MNCENEGKERQRSIKRWISFNGSTPLAPLNHDVMKLRTMPMSSRLTFRRKNYFKISLFLSLMPWNYITHGAISCIFHTLCTYDICFWKERPMWGNYCWLLHLCFFYHILYLWNEWNIDYIFIYKWFILYILLSISYSFQCQNLLLLFQTFWTHCIHISTILTKCRNDSTCVSCSLFFCISYVTCDPVVASSGFLSSLILRYRGKRSEMPFSGSTWWPRREW